MEFFTTFSDDQLALMGCAAAFFLFGGLMSVSYYVGRAGRTSTELALRAGRIARNESAASGRADRDSAPRDERKAA